MNRYATYLRVSTQRQGAQGLGISAQRTMCENFIKQNNGSHTQEFMDVESGTHRDRKGLWQAIDYCQKNDCGLVIAKLDRLARDVEFTFKVINTGIDIHFTDMPVVNSMILGVFASVAQYEREMISKRTKDALSVKKSQGYKLGANNETYRQNYNNKTYEEKMTEHRKKGITKTLRYLESRDVQAFIKALRKAFPDYTQGDIADWQWNYINTKSETRAAILSTMRDFNEIDDKIFAKWDFSDLESVSLQRKLSNQINSLKRSATNKNLFNN